MLGNLYPNLELAQAKSSLKYRTATFHGSMPSDRLKSRDASPAQTSSQSPSRRQYHVPALSYSHSESVVALFDNGSPVRVSRTAGGRRRRRAELSPSSRSQDIGHSFHRSSSPNDETTRAATATRNVRIYCTTEATVESSSPPPRLSPTQLLKLDTIDHIIARADDQGTVEVKATILDPLTVEGAEAATVGAEHDQFVRATTPSPSRRKVLYLMKQNKALQRETIKLGGVKATPPSPDKDNRTVPSPHQLSRRYLITAPETAARTSPSPSLQSPVLSPLPVTQESQRTLNNARVMEFVDAANNKPRAITTTSPNGGTATISLDKQLRRISLVSFEQANGTHASTRRLLTRSSSSIAMRRKQMFGIYSIREVMAVVRLFWFLDVDRSGGITRDELSLHRDFFTQLGRNDLDAVFRELDVDGNGAVSLSELLRVCFRHANEHQLQAMLTLAKVGDLHEYLTGRRSSRLSSRHVDRDKPSDDEQEERRKELMEIFRVFDRNGDGLINRDELFEALEIDRELFAPALETSRGAWAENTRRLERAQAGGLTKEDIDRFYQECDKNGDNVLEFDEFVKLMEAAST